MLFLLDAEEGQEVFEVVVRGCCCFEAGRLWVVLSLTGFEMVESWEVDVGGLLVEDRVG